MRDCLASTLIEESYGMQYAEWGFTPHDYHNVRNRIAQGLSHPDDVRAMAVSGLNRKFRYTEHYMKKAGEDQKKMIAA